MSLEHSGQLCRAPPGCAIQLALVDQGWPSEPVLVHACQEFACDRKTRGCADDSVDFTLRAKRRLAIINPLRYLAWEKHGKAVEAPTERTAVHLDAVQTAMLVRPDMGRIETLRIQPKHDGI